MTTIACIIARTNSTRLKQKVLKKIGNITLIEYIIRKIKKAKNIDEIYLCTSDHPSDNILLEIADKNDIKSYAGSEESVIDRMLDVAHIANAKNVIRVTGDNIFTDEIYIDIMLEKHKKNKAEYTRTEHLPFGVTAEIIDVKALKKCYQLINPDESQYLMLYMFNPRQFKCQVLIPPAKHQREELTLTIDTPEDFKRTMEIIGNQTNEILNLEQILSKIDKSGGDIPYLNYIPGNVVRFPANLTLTYSAFKLEIANRVKQSQICEIMESEYNKYVYAK